MSQILLIDDDPMILSIVQSILEAEAYEVVLAESAVQGQKILQDRSEQGIKAIILDVMMPDLSGLEFLKRLQDDELYQDIPVIMLTCRDDPKDVQDAYEQGASYYLTKPFSSQQLFHALNLVEN